MSPNSKAPNSQLRHLTEKTFLSNFVGLILNSVNAFPFWVHAQCLIHGTVNSRAVRASLYSDQDSLMCARSLLAWHMLVGRRGLVSLLHMTSSVPCWVGHVPGWEILGERAAQRTTHLEWETEHEQWAHTSADRIKIEGTIPCATSGNSQVEQGRDVFLSTVCAYLGLTGPSVTQTPRTPPLPSFMVLPVPHPNSTLGRC